MSNRHQIGIGEAAIQKTIIEFRMHEPAFSDPLIDAAATGDLSAVEKMLSESANVKARDAFGRTPLIAAAALNPPCALEIIERLLKAGADVNAQNNNGRTALMETLSKRNAPIVDLLLRHGANIHLRNRNGDSAASIISQHDFGTAGTLIRHAASKKRKRK